ncbi:MAG: hypothetical protein J6Y10_10485 [Lachnospiraceae bacterium]|nr:hypothetical protein [Lachnospiraceae bacterium]
MENPDAFFGLIVSVQASESCKTGNSDDFSSLIASAQASESSKMGNLDAFSGLIALACASENARQGIPMFLPACFRPFGHRKPASLGIPMLCGH